MLLKARFSEENIREDTQGYSLEGKIEPKLFNLGEGNVRVNNVLIKPQEAFNAGFNGFESTGSLRIVFEDKNANNLVTCFYGTLVEEKKCT